MGLIANWSSVQFSRSLMSDSLRSRELHPARPLCPSPTPRVYPNSYPSSQWCHPAISSSVVSFSFCPQSLRASESFPMSQLFATPWTAARQASLSITNSQSLLRLIFIASVITSNHLILCHPLLLLPSIFPSIRVFSNESVLHIKWLKYWSFSFRISPSNEHPGLISFRMD